MNLRLEKYLQKLQKKLQLDISKQEILETLKKLKNNNIKETQEQLR